MKCIDVLFFERIKYELFYFEINRYTYISYCFFYGVVLIILAFKFRK